MKKKDKSHPEQTRKYTFRFGDRKIVFNKSSHETEFHPYARALVFELFHRQYQTLQVEAKVDERFQPDLSAQDYDGTMVFWAEVGNVSMDKVEKLFKKYRRANYVFVKEEKEIPLFVKQLEKRAKEIHTLPLIEIVVWNPQFQEWWVSEEGDVFLPKNEVQVIRWHEPEVMR